MTERFSEVAGHKFTRGESSQTVITSGQVCFRISKSCAVSAQSRRLTTNMGRRLVRPTITLNTLNGLNAPLSHYFALHVTFSVPAL